MLTTTRSTSANASMRRRAKAFPSSSASRVHRERAAAALRRRDDLEAVGCENARGRCVHVREDRALHAAGEEADAPARRAARRRDGWHRALAAPARRDLDERAEPLRQRRGAAERRQPQRGAHAAADRGGGGRGARGRGGRRAAARAPPRRRPACSRSAGRSARPTGTRTGRPCSRGSGRSAAATVAFSAIVPSRRASMRWMRPRGESISSRQSTYVGHVGRQKPQWTQSRRVLADHAARTPCGSSCCADRVEQATRPRESWLVRRGRRACTRPRQAGRTTASASVFERGREVAGSEAEPSVRRAPDDSATPAQIAASRLPRRRPSA